MKKKHIINHKTYFFQLLNHSLKRVFVMDYFDHSNEYNHCLAFDYAFITQNKEQNYFSVFYCYFKEVIILNLKR